jgi:hypothetical protein
VKKRLRLVQKRFQSITEASSKITNLGIRMQVGILLPFALGECILVGLSTGNVLALPDVGTSLGNLIYCVF